jgi:hypothetical protein
MLNRRQHSLINLSAVLTLTFTLTHGTDFGVEFTSWPEANCDVLPMAYAASWTSPQSGAIVAVDSNGWPLNDSYAVLFDYAPQQNYNTDASSFVPQSIWGTYTVTFQGKGDIILYPGIGTLLNSTFDNVSFTTSAYVSLLSNDNTTTPGLVLGASNTQRKDGRAGFTDFRVLQPGCSSDGTFFTKNSLSAVSPFHHLRVHEWSGTNTIPVTYPETVTWGERRLLTDVFWASGSGGKLNAVGAPWESSLLLSKEADNISLWINIPVYASVSYVEALAALFRFGNLSLGIPGLSAPFLYVEHGNELWLNETDSPLNYAYNLAAAIGEVTAGGSPLNNDGNTDTIVWAQRRHAKRVREIGQVFREAFSGSQTIVRPVYAWFQEYTEDAEGAMNWLEATYGVGEAEKAYYGIAVNGYRGPGIVNGVPPLPGNSSPDDVLASLLAASDAAAPSRKASFALARSFNLSLLSYEGSGWASPAGSYPYTKEFNVTVNSIITLNRGSLGAEQQAYDAKVGWGLEGELAAMNFYALSSNYWAYDAACFGLTEDVGSAMKAPKYAGVMELIGRSHI